MHSSTTETPPSQAPGVFALLKTIGQRLLDHPVDFVNRVIQHPAGLGLALDTPKRSIALANVVAWDRLGKDSSIDLGHKAVGTLVAWRYDGNFHRSELIARPDLAHLVQKEVIPEWRIDIAQLDGFSASRSNLDAFTHTDLMVEADSRDLIADISLEGLSRNLAHPGIHILHRDNCTDLFVTHSWDGRFFLANDDGSHHLAAAKYLAARLGVTVPLKARLHRSSLNKAAIASLRRDFEIFSVRIETDISGAFYDAMDAYAAPWAWCNMPPQYGSGATALFLPRGERRSMRLAAVLHAHGIPDLGTHLASLN